MPPPLRGNVPEARGKKKLEKHDMNSKERYTIRDDWWNNRKGKAFTMYNDPGHAWLAVRRNELKRLGIMDKISRCSYQKGSVVYLEEDCDFSVFVSARIARNKPFHVIEKYTDGFSPIRDFQSFNPAQSA
jgi:hypothetical protein